VIGSPTTARRNDSTSSRWIVSTLDGARPDAHEFGGVLDRPAGGDVGGKHVHLALGRRPGKGAAQVPVPHALRAVDGRDCLGVRLIIRKRRDC
jgi:hypothetical protein